MKTIKLFSVFLFFTMFAYVSIAQTDPIPANGLTEAEIIKVFPESEFNSDIILFEHIDIDNSDTLNFSKWKQNYFNFKKSDYGNLFHNETSDLIKAGNKSVKKNKLELGVLNIKYDLVKFQNREEISSYSDLLNYSEIEQKEFIALSAFIEKIYTDYCYELALDFDNHISNAQPTSSIKIDFDDGKGIQEIFKTNGIVIQYSKPGKKIWRVEITLADYTVKEHYFEINVQKLSVPNPDYTVNFTADTAFYNTPASGEVYFKFGTGTHFENPVIVVEGLDIMDNLNWPELYELINQEMFTENLLQQGYDLILLNFDDAVDYVENNAMLLSKLIETVIDSLPQGSEITLIGASMGGLVSRFSLLWFEHQKKYHYVKKLITFDTPNKGATIPIGLQYWADFFSQLSADAEFFVERMNSYAARQLLFKHYVLPATPTIGPNQLFYDLQTGLDTLGEYPKAPLLIGIADGNGSGVGLNYSPGAKIIEYEYSSFLVDLVGNCWACPENSSTMVFEGLYDPIWPLSGSQMDVSIYANIGLDNTPGGMRSSMLDLQNTQAPFGQILALQQNHCFIPTISALDIDTSNFYYSAANDSFLMDNTPFDFVYYSNHSLLHVAMDDSMSNWLTNAIQSFATSQIELAVLDINVFPNPSSKILTVELDQIPKKIQIYSTTGTKIREIFGQEISGKRTVFDISELISGVYFLNIELEKGTIKTKFVKSLN